VFRKLQKIREENLEFLKEQKKRAESFIQLMKVTVERKREYEEKRKGTLLFFESKLRKRVKNEERKERGTM
jgi:hypothetical protein